MIVGFFLSTFEFWFMSRAPLALSPEPFYLRAGFFVQLFNFGVEPVFLQSALISEI
jgi:hypothetical protein